MLEVNAPSCAGLHVLVVDDHDDTRDLLIQVLTYAGATVSEARTAGEALGTLDGADVLVTDYSMPGNTGVWLLARVRERSRPVPVIMLTGHADLHARELTQAHFARVLRKPIDPWALCRAVAEVVHGR